MEPGWNGNDSATGSSRSGSSRSSQIRTSSASYDRGSSRASERRHVYEELRLQLQALTEKYYAQEKRASDAERELQEAATQLQRMNQSRAIAAQEAEKLGEELRLYKLRYNEAREEITRAQDMVRTLDRQKRNAEREAIEARTTARRLNQEIMIKAAMEEGRKMGLQEGLKRGRELALHEAEMITRYEETDGDEGSSEGSSMRFYRPRSPDEGVRQTPPVDEAGSPSPAPAPPPPEPEVTPAPSSAPALAPAFTPAPAQPAPLSESPTHVPPPATFDQPPRMIHNASPSVYHNHVDFPPEGFIPDLDPDNLIRLPPPHELSPMHRISDLQAATPGPGRQSPLPPATEAPNTQAQPAPVSVSAPIPTVPQTLRHQPSWGALSARSNHTQRTAAADQRPVGGVYVRPRTNSSSSGGQVSAMPSRRAPSHHAPTALGAQSPAGRSQNDFPPPGAYTPSATSEIGLPLPAPFTGDYDGSQNMYDSEGAEPPPVIPSGELFGDGTYDDSASTGSRESLTTPPQRHAKLHKPPSTYVRSAVGSHTGRTQQDRPLSRATNATNRTRT